MKFVFKLSLLSLVFFTLNSCSSSEPDDEVIIEEQLALSTLNVFSADQESQSVTVTSNLYWYTELNVDWITLSPRFGTDNGAINVTVASNPNFEERTGTITVIGGVVT